MSVSRSVGAYITIAMCMFIVISVGAVANCSRMSASPIGLVPTRFPSISSDMN